MAWILPLCDFGKISCQDSTESMPVGRIRSVRFGSNLDMSSQRSNKHQNLWNSLVVMVMAWLNPTFHEIRRSVGGENHRYRPPTHPHSQTLLAPSNKVEKERSLVSWTQRMHTPSYLGFRWLTPSPLNIDPQNDSMENMIHFLFSILGGFARFSKTRGMLSSLSTHS